MTIVWAIHDPLTTGEKCVLLRLADFADDTGGSVFPGVNRIAADCRMSRRGVMRALKRLAELGLIATVQRGAGKRTSRRQLNVQRLHAAANGAPSAPMSGALSAPKPSVVNRQVKYIREGGMRAV